MVSRCASNRLIACGTGLVLAMVTSCGDGASSAIGGKGGSDGVSSVNGGKGGHGATAGANVALGGGSASVSTAERTETGGRTNRVGTGGSGGSVDAVTSSGGGGARTSVLPTVGGAQASGGSIGGTVASTSAGGLVGSGGSVGGRTSSAHTGGSGQGGSSSTSTSVTEATIVPDASWSCGMAGGIPEPTRGTPVLSVTLQWSGAHDVGDTQFGRRRMYVVKGGTFTGDRLKGTVLSGGLDFELSLSNGSVELEEILVLRTSDNTPIYLRICGVAPAGAKAVRIVPDFEVATSSAFAWLNSGKFVGTRVVDSSTSTIQLAIYDVTTVVPSEQRVEIRDPAGVQNQSWDCTLATGTKGAVVFTETVTLGTSIAIGASKRGTRNIIPITGGTTSGRVAGAVVAAGGDYQLMGSSTTLDARYALATNDGEYVLVRNCGAMNALVPQFEARVAGSYAFLNGNAYLSSAPGSATGGVSITFYERK